MSYRVPLATTRAEQTLRKSRFIGEAARVDSIEAARDHRHALRQEFASATHHCWAYVIGDPDSTTRIQCEDDSEPSGTAGRPILSALRHHRLGDVQLVVVRFFGGIKLGAGGLVRAYSGTASRVLSSMSVANHHETLIRRLCIPYRAQAQLRRVLAEAGAEILDVRYESDIVFEIRLRRDEAGRIEHRIDEITAGQAQWSPPSRTKS